MTLGKYPHDSMALQMENAQQAPQLSSSSCQMDTGQQEINNLAENQKAKPAEHTKAQCKEEPGPCRNTSILCANNVLS